MEHNFKTTNIRGKAYVEVSERIKYFRSAPAYKGWSLETEIIAIDAETCVVKAIIKDDSGRIIATGLAQEDRSSSMVNKTSYVENAETSSWGRCLANLGIGIDTSIASSNEVAMAISKQESVASSDILEKAIAHILSSSDKDKALKAVTNKYKFNKAQLSQLKEAAQ